MDDSGSLVVLSIVLVMVALTFALLIGSLLSRDTEYAISVIEVEGRQVECLLVDGDVASCNWQVGE